MNPQSEPAIVSDQAPTDSAWNRWVLQTARRWSDVEHLVLKTGVESVDDDHRQLTEIALEISNLIDLVDEQGIRLSAIKEQGEAIQSMYNFAKEHFDREIGIIQRYSLPGLEIQREQHAYFLKMMQGFLDDFNNGRLTASLHLKNSVLDWWVTHINQVDHETFKIQQWTKGAIQAARNWDDVAEIIKTTGIETLDDEHRQMTEIALELATIYDETENKEIGEAERAKIDSVFERLIAIARQHFANEETFIKVFELNGLDTQLHQHGGFIRMLDGLRIKAVSGDRQTLVYARQSILLWWITHINEIDYNVFSLDKWAHVILTASTSWEDASEFISKTGQTVIDEDHEQITVFLLEIDGIIKDFEDPEKIEKARKKGAAFFEDLFMLAENHFKHEEAMMAKNQYISLETHRGQHQKFLTLLTRLKRDLTEGRSILTKSIKKHILEWWVGHIREYDLKAFGKGRFVDSKIKAEI